jgi:uncharacterized membrane protein YgdD (TMEM256/DUF423 family)
MSDMSKLRITGFSGAIAVALGALGAHALKPLLSADALSGFETATRYHLVHVVAMLGCVVFSRIAPHRLIDYAFRLFFWGTVLFSGSLYLLCTRALWAGDWIKVLGPVTPIGGLALIAGWLCIFAAGLNKR